MHQKNTQTMKSWGSMRIHTAALSQVSLFSAIPFLKNCSAGILNPPDKVSGACYLKYGFFIALQLYTLYNTTDCFRFSAYHLDMDIDYGGANDRPKPAQIWDLVQRKMRGENVADIVLETDQKLRKSA